MAKSNSLLSGMAAKSNAAFTANMDKAYKSTNSLVLDMFSRAGAMRGRSESDIIKMFDNAYAEDKDLALKCLFYNRDFKGSGNGEREFFRICIKHLAKIDAASLRKNLKHIKDFGRFDDLWELFGTSVEKDVIAIVKEQWSKDIESANKNQPVSLLSKWLPSIVTSSKGTVKQAKILARGLGIDEKSYRKTRSALNKKLNVVETIMSAGHFELINFNEVPSCASKIYRGAFKKRDESRYVAWQEDVKKAIEDKAAGKIPTTNAKVNADVLYPYELVRECRNNKWDMTVENQWKSLPDFGGDGNIMCCIDTSGSMSSGCGTVAPADVALSLGIYFAERNNGAFKDHFITFSSRPELVKLKGTNLQQKLQNIRSIVEITDLRAAFKLILDTAISHNVPQEEMPKALVVISDCQFDSGQVSNTSTAQDFKKMFNAAGYEAPICVYWNVNSSDNSPVTQHSTGHVLVSGGSVNAFKAINKFLESGEMVTPYSMMVSTLNDGRYACIAA